MIHPSIDACVQLRDAQGVKPEQIERIELKVHSLVLELTGKKEPADGLQSKFSVYHGCAAGLIFGRAGEDEYADDVVNRARRGRRCARKVVATVDDAHRRGQRRRHRGAHTTAARCTCSSSTRSARSQRR